jgi:hypothetical protein
VEVEVQSCAENQLGVRTGEPPEQTGVRRLVAQKPFRKAHANRQRWRGTKFRGEAENFATKLCFGESKRSRNSQPRMRTALKLRITWPPAVGLPKLSMGRKRENKSIWSS